ncbi:MAG: UTP-glucose-phosphate uridylyltransferase, UTP--glucose-phosphate uridylyltransferase [Candidatus Saccharibacteria bacterium]|jgi:UTP--glucose-1-phosphate uridylyltransferase|nr:UTP-glucose-phosphate uridylyltransferase, UTP--glucose-phosphate uridylyltransferase [Candidatus Saccharibacteria bacterium]
MKVTTAVIFAAGFGSRMLPVTSAVQKELLPILDRPIVDYVVADCVAAGITDIIFVIRAGAHGIQDFYTGNAVLEGHLERFKKEKDLANLKRIHSQATYTFVEQRSDAGYGTAIPLQLAAEHLPDDEAFIVCGADDFMWRTDGSDLKDLVDTFQQSQAAGAIMTLEKPDDELPKYGVLEIEEKDGREYLKGIVEKPKAGEAPSNHINISKYVMTPAILEYIMKIEKDEASGEFLLTDGVQAAAKDQPIVVQQAAGKFLDGGSVASWLEANLTVAQSRPELSERFRVYNR